MRTPTLAGIVIAFIILLALFRALEFFRARDRRLPIRRRGLVTDTAYWLFTPFVTKAITRVCVAAVVIPFALVAYGEVDRTLLEHGFGPAGGLPLWMQAAAILLIGDFVGYWMHRAFHGRRLWRFHAVHHSSVDLDWLSSVRLHPVNDALMRVAGTLPVLALGFAPMAVAGIIPVLTFMAILVHANLDWDWGPLRGIVVSPASIVGITPARRRRSTRTLLGSYLSGTSCSVRTTCRETGDRRSLEPPRLCHRASSASSHFRFEGPGSFALIFPPDLSCSTGTQSLHVA